MKKTSTHYSAHERIQGNTFALNIEINNEIPGCYIKCAFEHLWGTKEDAIDYLKWCIKQIEGLEE